MIKEYAFELPAKNEQIAEQIVQAVPDTWRECNGQLVAPLEADAVGNTAGAGFVLNSMSRFGKVEIATPYDRELRDDPSNIELRMEVRERVAQLLTGAFMPSFVSFQKLESTGEFGLVPMHSAKFVITSYLSRGYKGDLFFNERLSDDTDKLGSEIDLHTESWSEQLPRRDAATTFEYIDGKPVFDTPRREHPPLVKMKLIDDTATALLDLCQRFDLAELDPVDIRFGYSLSHINV